MMTVLDLIYEMDTFGKNGCLNTFNNIIKASIHCSKAVMAIVTYTLKCGKVKKKNVQILGLSVPN